jgi:hypothetical protein
MSANEKQMKLLGNSAHKELTAEAIMITRWAIMYFKVGRSHKFDICFKVDNFFVNEFDNSFAFIPNYRSHFKKPTFLEVH